MARRKERHEDPERSVDFGFEKVPWTRKGRARARGIQLRRRQVRRDERFDVVRRPPPVEAVRAVAHRPQGRPARARRRRRDRRSRHRSSRARWARPGRWSSRTSTRRCSRPAATGCSTWGYAGNVECVLADAERLPFADDSFDCVTIGFGLRNVTDKAAALSSMHRVLKPGGQLLVLEFSKPVAPGLKPLYDAYSFNVLPRHGRLGGQGCGELPLPRRIDPHASGSGDPARACSTSAGFGQTRYHNLTGGIVAVHRGYKI